MSAPAITPNYSAADFPPDFVAEVEAAVWNRHGIKDGQEVRFTCPTHSDDNPSGRYNPAKHTWNCFICNPKGGEGGILNLAKELGIPLPERKNGHNQVDRDEIYSYYKKASDPPLYQVVRKPGKKFLQRRPNPDKPGSWLYNLEGVERVLYRLPELLAADPGELVHVVEGERDVNNLVNLGLIATTNSGGAGTGRWRAEYSEYLRGRDVVVLPDADDVGREHALEVARLLDGVAKSVKIIELPGVPEKGDVSDWLDQGHVVDELHALVEATPVWSSGTSTSLPTIHMSVGSEVEKVGLLEFSGDELATTGASEESLDYLPLLGLDGYLVKGWSHLLVSYPRFGKSELLVRTALPWIIAGLKVVYFTEEPVSIWRHRLSRLEGDWSGLHVVFGLGADPAELSKRAFEGTEDVVIVDTLRNLLRVQDETNNSELARVLNPWIADARKAEKTLLMAHHMRKGSGEHGEGIPGGHALLGVFDVALELLREPNSPNRRRLRGYARLIEPPELLYERNEKGMFVPLGDPSAVTFDEVKRRAQDAVTKDLRTTEDLRLSLDEPRPGQEQFRKALVSLAKEKVIFRDPGVEVENVQGKTVRWSTTSLPTDMYRVGSEVEQLALTTNDPVDLAEMRAVISAHALDHPFEDLNIGGARMAGGNPEKWDVFIKAGTRLIYNAPRRRLTTRRRRTMMSKIRITGAMEDMEYLAGLLVAEPRLAYLLRDVNSLRDREEGGYFCSSDEWLRIKVRLEALVGDYRIPWHAELSTSRAYDAVGDVIIDLLPPCRGDCPCAWLDRYFAEFASR